MVVWFVLFAGSVVLWWFCGCLFGFDLWDYCVVFDLSCGFRLICLVSLLVLLLCVLVMGCFELPLWLLSFDIGGCCLMVVLVGMLWCGCCGFVWVLVWWFGCLICWVLVVCGCFGYVVWLTWAVCVVCCSVSCYVVAWVVVGFCVIYGLLLVVCYACDWLGGFGWLMIVVAGVVRVGFCRLIGLSCWFAGLTFDLVLITLVCF